jgi:hypothetical protein
MEASIMVSVLIYVWYVIRRSIQGAIRWHKHMHCCESNIQCDWEGICNATGNDSLRDSKPNCSYEHVSDSERLPRYGKNRLRTVLLAHIAIT